MSREGNKINENITVVFGNDHVLGSFIDVIDNRFAESGQDEQGEGYVCEYSTKFGISNNRIGANIEDLKNKEKIIELCDAMVKRNFKFIKKIL